MTLIYLSYSVTLKEVNINIYQLHHVILYREVGVSKLIINNVLTLKQITEIRYYLKGISKHDGRVKFKAQVALLLIQEKFGKFQPLTHGDLYGWRL